MSHPFEVERIGPKTPSNDRNVEEVTEARQGMKLWPRMKWVAMRGTGMASIAVRLLHSRRPDPGWEDAFTQEQ
jgi:hypothetical protein